MKAIGVTLLLLMGMARFFAGCGPRNMHPDRPYHKLLLQANVADPGWPAGDAAAQKNVMETTRNTVYNRLRQLPGVSDPRVEVQDTNKLMVELPGAADPNAALKIIQPTATLRLYYLDNVRSKSNPLGRWQMDAKQVFGGEEYLFVDTKSNKVITSSDRPAVMKEIIGNRQPILTGRDILPNAKGSIDPNTERPEILVEFNKEGTAKFAQFTANHVGDVLAIFIDDQLLTAPIVMESITDGQCSVTGSENITVARRTAEFLNAGTTPVRLDLISKEVVK